MLGYRPPRAATADVVQAASEAVLELEKSLQHTVAKSETSKQGSPLLKLHAMLCILFLDASRLCINGYKIGHNRAAFALQRSL